MLTLYKITIYYTEKVHRQSCTQRETRKVCGMNLFGLTGGIASGKSAVLSLLRGRPGIFTIEYDLITKELLAEFDPQPICEILQADIITNGKLNRKKFLKALFANQDRKNQLERHFGAIAWKRIGTLLQEMPDTALVVIESALVYEAEIDHHFDAVISVTCGESTQLRRLIAREGITRGAAKKRIQSQLPNVIKSNRADFVINTDCSRDELEEAVDIIYHALTLW